MEESLKLAGVGSNLLTIGGFAARNVPLLGSGISAVSAGSRAMDKDYLGAVLDLGAAAANPFAGPGTLISGGLSTVNFLRDALGLSTPEQEKIRKHPFMKTAKTNFQQDIENPSAGVDSDLYNTISPMISSDEDSSLSGSEAARTEGLKSQVRKGLVGLEYLTGLKKNTGNTFYDEHPVQAVTTDLASKAPLLGLAVGGGGLAANYLNQIRNMHRTEPGKMSREGNKLDRTNAANLLNPSGDPSKNSRADISRIFGDLESNPELRLSVLDKLHPSKLVPGDPESMLQKFRALKDQKASLSGEHGAKLEELQKQFQAAAQTGDRKEISKMESLLKSHGELSKQEMGKLDAATKDLLSSARNHPGEGALHNYVDLHESLRRAKETGGLKSHFGEGLKHLGGVEDLLEKYHLTGANPHYNEELIRDIVKEYAGPHTANAEWENFASNALRRVGDPSHQASGLAKAWRRAKGPLTAGAITAGGGFALHQLLKMMQNSSNSPQKINQWKKTLLESQGDFDRAKQYEEQ